MDGGEVFLEVDDKVLVEVLTEKVGYGGVSTL
jgi:hypothetical protein